MFKIPAAVAGMPTEWKTWYFARNGDSLVPLQQYKIDTIRNQERRDWSKHILPGATIAHLDAAAIAFARERYKEKMNRPHIIEKPLNPSIQGLDLMVASLFFLDISRVSGFL